LGTRYSTGLPFFGLHDDAALGLVVLAELHAAFDLGDDRVILRLAGFEQLGHARQTAGDVAGLGAFPRIRASTSPAWTFWPFSTDRIESTDRK